MKIIIDSVWRKIEFGGEYLPLIENVSNSAYLFNKVVSEILTESQLNTYYSDKGSTFTLSKKKKEILSKYIKS